MLNDAFSARITLPETSFEPRSQSLESTQLHSLPSCPKPLPTDIEVELDRIAILWAKHPSRPRLEKAVSQHWDALIADWSNDPTLPLLIRKSEQGIVRGETIRHESGRELVLTDNSAASWSYMLAYSRVKPSIADVCGCLARDEIPVAMIVDREMKVRSNYKCSRVTVESPNALGWKVCHKKKVAVRGQGSVKQRRIADLQAHFRDFLAPSNMFLIPLLLGGLGEISHFIQAINLEPDAL